MPRIKIFISSVQSEFAEERQFLCYYISTDALLGKFFIPFIFEQLPAQDTTAERAYLEEVEQSDIYLGIYGQQYGNVGLNVLSATELEYNHATKHFKNRLVFLTNHTEQERDPRETVFIKQVEQRVIRKMFNSILDLKTSVYAALIRYLEEKEYIRISPFDATFNHIATLDDLDEDKIREFITIASRKRSFPFDRDSDIRLVLTHLNLLNGSRLTNAAILLFGKSPQRYFITSEVRCAHFHGFEVTKPIPSYQVYKGDVFQLVAQAVDFVLSKIDLYVGERTKSATVDVQYELPIQAVTEAIVNAVAHRDYTSNASIQVMLFKDRLEICNPGSLPYGLTTAKLLLPHNSMPANPLLAEPMYLRGTIERMGTGTGDIVKRCMEMGLPAPVFLQEDDFRVVLYRAVLDTVQDTVQETAQDTAQDTAQETLLNNTKIRSLLKGIGKKQLSLKEMLAYMQLKHTKNFKVSYLQPAIEQGYISLLYPDNPTHRNQRYSLTEKGLNISTYTVQETVQETAQDTAQETLLNNTKIRALLNGIGKKQLSLKEMLAYMQLKHTKNFKVSYLQPAIEQGYISLLYPDNPTHRNQRYSLTEKGLQALHETVVSD